MTRSTDSFRAASVMRSICGSPKGADNERRVLEAVLEKDPLYVVDRGYFDRNLLERIVAIGSSYVLRVRENIQYEVIEQRPLSAAAKADGVLSDQVLRLLASRSGQGRIERGPNSTGSERPAIRRVPFSNSTASSGYRSITGPRSCQARCRKSK
jgi:hypothetical protein